jgi:hypothetical protein
VERHEQRKGKRKEKDFFVVTRRNPRLSRTDESDDDVCNFFTDTTTHSAQPHEDPVLYSSSSLPRPPSHFYSTLLTPPLPQNEKIENKNDDSSPKKNSDLSSPESRKHLRQRVDLRLGNLLRTISVFFFRAYTTAT